MFMRMTLLCLVTLLSLSTSWAQEGAKPLIFPAPMKMQVTQGGLAVDRNTRIVVPPGSARLRAVAEMLSVELGKALNTPTGRLEVVTSNDPKAVDGRIALNVSGKMNVGVLDLDRAGAYVLGVKRDGALLVGYDDAGAFYGVTTLLQLFRRTREGRGEIATADVFDFPYHPYRGTRSALPRGKPRPGEITHEYYKNLLRLWGFCRLNHVWVQGCSFNTPLRRHPETAWKDVLTREQAKGLVDYANRYFLSMDGSLGWQWVYYKYKHLAELAEGETWEDMKKKSRRVCRVNVCPSKPETWKMLFETLEDTLEVLTGDHFSVPFDEMYQEYHGSRRAVCPLCKDKDPVKLYADMVNRVISKVLKHGKIPIMSGGQLNREHQGHYKDIYKAIDMIENRDKIVIYNWSEGAIRRGAMVRAWGGGPRPEYKIPDFSATPFFKKHGYKDVMHLFAGTNWKGRPEMREVKGKLDCYGGFVSYYHPMNYAIMKQRGTITRLIFTAQHLWSPDSPAMESAEDKKMVRYGEALADAICHGKSYVQAIELGRKAYAAPEGTKILTGGAMGRSFASKDPAVNLLGKTRGDHTEGEMKITE